MSSLNIISRLATRFENATKDRHVPDYFTRHIGGHFRNNQPYISGYFHAMFGLPNELFGETYVQTASKWLHSTCESFTPHSQTVNKVDVQGIGTLGSSFVASRTINREFTMAFREYQNLPILNIFNRWGSVFDPFTGVSPLDGDRFVPWNYKGWIAVAQIKPVRSIDADLDNDCIEECYIYQGVFPTTVPTDTIASDLTGNDTVQLSITFSFDGAPLTSAEPGVTDTVIELFKSMRYIGKSELGNSTYANYYDYGVNNVKQFGTHDGQNTSVADPLRNSPSGVDKVTVP